MIFNVASFFLIVMTFLFVVAVFIVWKHDYNDPCTDYVNTVVTTILGLIIVGLMGWGALGYGNHAINITQELPAQVLKTDYSVIVAVKGIPVTNYTDVITTKYFEDKSTCTLVQSGYVDIYYNTNWLINTYTIKP